MSKIYLSNEELMPTELRNSYHMEATQIFKYLQTSYTLIDV